MKASIILLTKNAGSSFYYTLKNIFSQNFRDFEVIIIDSGSGDRTLEIAKEFPLKIYTIPSEEFGHGKTRNLAVKLAEGEFMVYLTQDAIPANEFWLSSLLRNFQNERIAAAFSRQIPRKNSSAMEFFFYNHHFPNQRIIRPENRKFINRIFFSNVSSCIRKDILERFPFDETLIMSEDQKFAQDVMAHGYKTVYDPESMVIHSHKYSLKSVFQRYFDSAFSLKVITDERPRKFFRLGIDYTIRELKYIINKNPLLLPYMLAYNFSMFLGTVIGLYHKHFPLFFKKRISMHKYYWNSK